MLNKEIVQELFIESPVHDREGRIVPAPLVAIFMLDGIKKHWHAQKLGEGRTSLVSMGPCIKDGVEGYSIRKEIVYIK